jgi:hypothetical protein
MGLFSKPKVNMDIAGEAGSQWSQLNKQAWSSPERSQWLESMLGQVGRAEDLYAQESGFEGDLALASRQQAFGQLQQLQSAQGLGGANRLSGASMVQAINQGQLQHRGAAIGRRLQLMGNLNQVLGLQAQGIASMGPSMDSMIQSIASLRGAEVQADAQWKAGIYGAVAGGLSMFAMGGGK